jgi:hypothetical protein
VAGWNPDSAINEEIDMKKFYQAALASALVLLNVVVVLPASAEEFAQVCWLTDKGSLVRFSVTQNAPGHYVYTGIFNTGETDDTTHYAITGSVESGPNNRMAGSFTGSKTTDESFKTFTASVVLDPATLGGSVELIRNKFDRMNHTISVDYRNFTIAPAPCPMSS